ncbi:hypothetical protein [Aurantiacibacter arachoides]|uniref:hypothetical protein n=1 Tax=Aurantiacibacter arachoides TaxID=1850444 RepID=UPI001663F47C|nr:hypothetical protein [Aurantiacibacter arachoides]GGD47532.1 hypothetical protein GCM10011411_04070 [Aurantiacibacter arachoides]
MNKPVLVSALLLAGAALAICVVLPAETGWDPTGAGKALGLTQIADPVGPETERGQARMARQQVLAENDASSQPAGGVDDSWSVELGPFESVEFKYTIAEGDRMNFAWQASGPVHYDMHAHPFEGGEELTESYAIGDAATMRGSYTPAFTGIHGWFWENRSMEPVTLTLDAQGAMTTSTIFRDNGAAERPIAGATDRISGAVAGHRMQSEGEQSGNPSE